MVLPQENDQNTDPSKNPFIFKRHGIKNFSLLLNGVSVPQQALMVSSGSSTDNKSLRAYKYFLANMGLDESNQEIGISMDNYLSRDFAMVFDLTGDLCNGLHDHLPKSGELDLKISFDSVTGQPFTFVVISCYESYIMLDKGDVSQNYQC